MYDEQQGSDRGAGGVPGPLSGFSVGVTAARRAAELGPVLRR
ncbi:uroporphyrinogen-III synthase, partial [Streptomyces sp. NPDC127574]